MIPGFVWLALLWVGTVLLVLWLVCWLFPASQRDGRYEDRRKRQASVEGEVGEGDVQ
jgi:uncharacterized membrane-anchored protein